MQIAGVTTDEIFFLSGPHIFYMDEVIKPHTRITGISAPIGGKQQMQCSGIIPHLVKLICQRGHALIRIRSIWAGYQVEQIACPGEGFELAAACARAEHRHDGVSRYSVGALLQRVKKRRLLGTGAEHAMGRKICPGFVHDEHHVWRTLHLCRVAFLHCRLRQRLCGIPFGLGQARRGRHGQKIGHKAVCMHGRERVPGRGRATQRRVQRGLA